MEGIRDFASRNGAVRGEGSAQLTPVTPLVTLNVQPVAVLGGHACPLVPRELVMDQQLTDNSAVGAESALAVAPLRFAELGEGWNRHRARQLHQSPGTPCFRCLWCCS